VFSTTSASDKCKGESECLSFAEHMEATTELWKRHLNETGSTNHHPTVVFTTEAKSMMQEQQTWVKKNEQASLFEVDFVTNARDILPDSGFMKHVGRYTSCRFRVPYCDGDSRVPHKSSYFLLSTAERKEGIESDPDANMLSSMSSLKAQLLPRISIGNCCSNFHAMLNDFLLEGCGAASDNTFVCLQEYDDPLHRVCCGWHKECKARRDAYKAELQSFATAEEAFASAYTNAVYDPVTKELRPIERTTS